MNKFLTVIALVTVGAYAKAHPTEVVTSEETTAFNYHAKVGIGQAQHIRMQEELLLQDASRIVGGSQAAAGEHPYLVGGEISLMSGETSVCGACMVSNTRALTAAHCWWDGGNQAIRFRLRFGSGLLFSGGTRVDATVVQMHDGWNPTGRLNDIAILHFPHVDYSNVIQYVPLATGTANYAGSWARLSGYGKTGDGIESCVTDKQYKSHVTVEVITNAVCQAIYGTSYVAATSICTSGSGGVGACRGDSGGPLTTMAANRQTLIGVASFGPHIDCKRNLPTVYTRVSSYTAWIQARV